MFKITSIPLIIEGKLWSLTRRIDTKESRNEVDHEWEAWSILEDADHKGSLQRIRYTVLPDNSQGTHRRRHRYGSIVQGTSGSKD